MNVLLVGPDYEENLSLRYLSSSLRSAGYGTTLAAFNSRDDIPEVVSAAEHADIVGLSMCFQGRGEEFLELAQAIKGKNPEKLVVAGGHYASVAAAPLLNNHAELDVIVIHEGERTLVEIAEVTPNLQERLPHIRGIAYRSGGSVQFTKTRSMLEDLDALPFPDRNGPIRRIGGLPTSYMMGSRGCYGSCAYCCITALHRMSPGKRFRQRSPEHVAEEMAWLYHERGTRQFVFHDDNFLVPSRRLNEIRMADLERGLRRRGVKDIALVIKCRPADAQLDILQQFKELGLVRVFFGIESATEQGLQTLSREQTMEASIAALETCRDLDISAQFTLMIFNPDATLATIRADVDFMRRFSANPLNFCRTEIYAGTPLEARMIEQGRARGDYRARVYRLADPAADLACNLSLDLFTARCWGDNSLMQHAIGLDHVAAVVKRFPAKPGQLQTCSRIANWLRSVNLDTIGLLEEVVALSASVPTLGDTGLQTAVRDIAAREEASRKELFAAGLKLRFEVETGREKCYEVPERSVRLARRAAAALLAIGLPGTASLDLVAQQNKAPQASVADKQSSTSSLSGVITDPSGAVIPNASVSVRNLSTGTGATVKTNSAGQFVVGGLPDGNYTVEVESPGFKHVVKTGVVIKKASQETLNLNMQLQVSDIGCCEYAAIPMNVKEDFLHKKKPFTYYVGDDNDHNTLKGVAEVVYGDASDWVYIRKANPDITNAKSLPRGTALVIPVRDQKAPKLISKIKPIYPPEALSKGIAGDVLLEVTLKEDGTVNYVNVIDGDAQLAQAAVSAVQQWRYRANAGTPNRPFLVLISFQKGGKVR